MKFERETDKPFVPITITLETELDCTVMQDVFATDPYVLANLCVISSTADIRECFSKGTINTAYEQLTAIKER